MSLTAPIIGGKGTVNLSEAVFGVEVAPGLLHEVAKAEAAGRRQGTHATKTRGMVAGGRAKPFNQKGTGRARQGTTRAAQFTGGGAVFGPQPRSYAVKVNKKAYKKARCMGLSQHAGNGSLGIFEAGSFDTPKTKDALKLVEGWSVAPLVVVVGSEEEAAALSFRNIPRSAVLTPTEVGLTELLWARRLLISTTALDELSASLDSSKQKDEVTA
ncbi:MAG: 50S ribosomal protein L4 [Gaiellales bacterium]|jgi:large subunit ribosomal protein L4|nr:50S ribosomal protein L4 [Gaiellales bacterium]